jgi:hypothetical protein
MSDGEFWMAGCCDIMNVPLFLFLHRFVVVVPFNGGVGEPLRLRRHASDLTQYLTVRQRLANRRVGNERVVDDH